MPDLDDDQCWQSAAVALESILGEDVLMNTISEFSLTRQLSPEMAKEARSIHQLASAFVGDGGGKA